METQQEVKLKKSFSFEKDVNWELFTDEEKEKLEACYNNGEYFNLTCLPGVAIDTPAREIEIDKIAISLRVTVLDSESEVRQELDEFWADPANEMTPELEAKFQEKIDAELAEKRKITDGVDDDENKKQPGNESGDNSKDETEPPPSPTDKNDTGDNKNEAAKLNIDNKS